VAHEGEYSDQVTVDSGVQQGTVLGPILFLYRINDLPNSVKSSVKLFADDCLLYREINSENDHTTLQNLEKWASDWGMRFNAKMCYNLSMKKKSHHSYTLNNQILEQVPSNPYLGLQVPSNPYLGLQIAEDLKWKEHINNTCKKASSTLEFLSINLQHCPRECRRTAYIAIVRSIMKYESVIWDPYTKQEITKPVSIQRRGTRFITKDYKSREEGCMTKMLNELNLPTLQSRRHKQRLIFFHKVVEGQVPAMPPDLFVNYQKPNKGQIRAKTFDNCVTTQCTNIVTSSARNNTKCIAIPGPSRTDQYKHSFFIRTAIDWNHQENTVSAEKLESFKSALAVHRD
jgi:hypothetical protein